MPTDQQQPKRRPYRRGRELLDDLRTRAERTALRYQVEPDAAALIAIELVDDIRRAWGNSMIYMPQGVDLDLEERDLEIWGAFKPYNYAELAARFGLSESSIRARLRRVRDHIRNRPA